MLLINTVRLLSVLYNITICGQDYLKIISSSKQQKQNAETVQQSTVTLLMMWLCASSLHSCCCLQAAAFQYGHQKDGYITWKPSQWSHAMQREACYRQFVATQWWAAFYCPDQLLSRSPAGNVWIFLCFAFKRAKTSVGKDRILRRCWTATSTERGSNEERGGRGEKKGELMTYQLLSVRSCKNLLLFSDIRTNIFDKRAVSSQFY